MAKTGNRALDERKVDAVTTDRAATVVTTANGTQRWEWQDDLGSGSFGKVFSEKCVAGPANLIGTLRAVKVLDKPTTATAQADLGRELSTLFLASRDGAPDRFTRAHGWWESPTDVYIAMDCFEDGDLYDNIRRPLPEKDAATIIRQLLEAAQYLHSKNITHRDIKPRNLMVKSRPTSKALSTPWDVKLGDFGLAERHKNTKAFGFLNGRGTPDYLGPEITGDGCEESESGYLTPPP
ncbi:kinase-like domain-containing protein [Podospora aff. communis PSN243]|uniref:Kinase-like domain-containing protein n=1 Tax=Podospora aff. communis PSN243 TaxID=3040156 RepID=A0AAV9G2V1_9PEZI|nr:kinase-like domain-containing protein [Podospora aff. communis PSN243]